MAIDNHRGRVIIRVAVAATVVCLHNQERLKTVGFHPRLFDGCREALIGIQIFLRQQELCAGGSALFHN